MDLVATPTGLATFAVLAALYMFFAKTLPLGALSLPCLVLLTSSVYFFVIPALAFRDGIAVFFNVSIHSLEWVHIAVFLYAIGAAIACIAGRRHLLVNPARTRPQEREINEAAFWMIAAATGAGIAILTLTDQLNLTNDEDFVGATNASAFKFVQLSISMLLPLTVVYAVRDNFGPRAMALVTATVFIILVTGFRYRLAILMIGLVGSFWLLRGRKIGVLTTAFGATLAIVLFNAIRQIRTYGAGFNLDNLESATWSELLRAFGGEIGPIFALYGVIENPPGELIGAEPWIVAIARLVPSFLWPDKPAPHYLAYTLSAFDERTQVSAGIAPPQHAEILLQVGWWGLPVLAFLYFMIIIQIGARLNRLSREARIAGAALLPGLFGFYMQQRGYFFQNMVEAIFIICPLFLMHVRSRKKRARGALEPFSEAPNSWTAWR